MEDGGKEEVGEAGARAEAAGLSLCAFSGNLPVSLRKTQVDMATEKCQITFGPSSVSTPLLLNSDCVTSAFPS